MRAQKKERPAGLFADTLVFLRKNSCLNAPESHAFRQGTAVHARRETERANFIPPLKTPAVLPCRRHKRRRAGKAQGRSLGLPHLRRAQENTRALKIPRTRARHSQQSPQGPGGRHQRRHSARSECWPTTKLRCRHMHATDKTRKMRAQQRTTTKPARKGREVPARDDGKFANMGENEGPSGGVCRVVNKEIARRSSRYIQCPSGSLRL